MSEIPSDVMSLAMKLREIAAERHNASRAESGLRPVDLGRWFDLPIDVRRGWIGAAEHVMAHWSPRDIDQAATVRAAGAAIYARVPMLLDREQCDTLARAALEAVGTLRPEPAAAMSGGGR